MWVQDFKGIELRVHPEPQGHYGEKEEGKVVVEGERVRLVERPPEDRPETIEGFGLRVLG